MADGEKANGDNQGKFVFILIIHQYFKVDRLDLALHRQQRSFEVNAVPAEQRLAGYKANRQR